MEETYRQNDWMVRIVKLGEREKVARGKEETQARIKWQKLYKVCDLFKLKQNEKDFRKAFVKLNRLPPQHNVSAPAHLLSTKLG